ncbi:hypothetical protein ACHAWF_010002 [Thalassiosira exigua]
MLRLSEASKSFGKVYEIKPEAYLWQDGLVKYYLDDCAGAALSLAKNAERYEGRFGEPASEERIWRDAVELRLGSSNAKRKGKRGGKAKGATAARAPAEGGEGGEEAEKESIGRERRKVLRLARQLFSHSLRDNPAGTALARAQLEAACGDAFPSSLASSLPRSPERSESRPPATPLRPDYKMRRLHSLFYLGLHYDALGMAYEAKRLMKAALRAGADGVGGNNDRDVTYLLPVIHVTVRDWYDDDEFEEGGADASSASRAGGDGSLSGKEDGIDDPISSSSDQTERRLRDSIGGMRVVDLRGDLRRRGLKVSGSKRELQDRLVEHLREREGGA